MSSTPYSTAAIPESLPTGESGSFAFDYPGALEINQARMSHLGSLGLQIEGRSVLDVGCGVGHLARFFVERGCKVQCVDGRRENIEELARRYPDLPGAVVNGESQPLQQFGSFDIVFCYGLLYHLENPLAGLRNMAAVCKDLLLLETLVTDHSETLTRLVEEPNSTWNQSLARFGTRPTPAFVALALNRIGFSYVYAAKNPPDHVDFKFEFHNGLDCMRDGHPIRGVFVASRQRLDNGNLTLLLGNEEIAARANESVRVSPDDGRGVIAEPLSERTNWGSGWPVSLDNGGDPLLRDSFDVLRKKWSEVPISATGRVHSSGLLRATDEALLKTWWEGHRQSSAADAFSVRGGYQTIYRDVFRGKRILDFGCGLAIDTLLYAQNGATVTFVDLVRSNVEVVRRLSEAMGLSGNGFCYMEDLSSLDELPTDFDVIYCCGSLIHAPLEVTRREAQALLPHLKIGGRWIELAYPKGRWEREGRLPFPLWGEKTDGGAPWAEWHDLAKVREYLAPSSFEVVMEMEFHGGDFNWFDLIRRS